MPVTIHCDTIDELQDTLALLLNFYHVQPFFQALDKVTSTIALPPTKELPDELQPDRPQDPGALETLPDSGLPRSPETLSGGDVSNPETEVQPQSPEAQEPDAGLEPANEPEIRPALHLEAPDSGPSTTKANPESNHPTEMLAKPKMKTTACTVCGLSFEQPAFTTRTSCPDCSKELRRQQGQTKPAPTKAKPAPPPPKTEPPATRSCIDCGADYTPDAFNNTPRCWSCRRAYYQQNKATASRKAAALLEE